MSKGQQMVKRIVENYMLKDKKSNQWVARSGKSANDIFYYFTEKRDEALKFKSQEEVDAEKERMKSMGFKTDIFEVVPESADYQKKRFKEPYYMYNESSKAIKESVRLSNEDDLYYWMLDYMEKNKGKGSTSLQFITDNGNNIIISWNMKQYNGISIDGQKMNMGEFCHHRMKGVGIQDVWEADMNTGRFKPIKEDAPQKIVIKNAWGVEVKDYKAGDPIPAGAKFKIFNAKDTDKIEAYADSLFESVSSKTHKFRPEELKVGKRVIDKVGGKEVHGKITINHNDLYGSNPYTPEMKGSTVVTIQTDSGRSYDVDANDNGGEFILEGCKGKKKISEGYTVIFPTGASQKLKTIADVNKFVNGVLHMKDKNASDVQLTDATLDKWNKENDIPLVVVKESQVNILSIPVGGLFKDKVFGQERTFQVTKHGDDDIVYAQEVLNGKKIVYDQPKKVEAIKESFIIQDSDSNDKPVYFHYGKYTGYDWGFDKNSATKFSTKEAAERMLEKMRQEGMLINSMKVVSEGRIAKGYENLDADEKARHLLSHPSSKYMSDLKSENITERAIRKAVKEMLGKPDKRDPEFITDVNEGCGKVQESFLIVGKLPYDDLKQAYISYSDKGIDIHTPEYKKHATRFSSRQEAQKVLDLMKKEGWKTEKFEIVQEEGEAPATTTANVATPELPMKLKEATKVPYLLKNAKVGDTFHDGSDLGREYKITRVTPSKVYATCVKDPNTTGEYNRNHPDYAETDPQWAKLYTIKESVGQKLNISLARKPYNMKDVDEDIRLGNANRVKAIVDKSYKLSASEYDKFVYNFMVHTTYLNGEGGVDSDGTVHVIEITAPGKKTIYVDPEGYDYARYVGY